MYIHVLEFSARCAENFVARDTMIFFGSIFCTSHIEPCTVHTHVDGHTHMCHTHQMGLRLHVRTVGCKNCSSRCEHSLQMRW